MSAHGASDQARPYEPAHGRAVRRITAGAVRRRKGTPFPIVTAYDAPFAGFAEAAGIDILLVGDSLANVVLGYDETTPITVEVMIHHAQAVVRGTTRAHIVVDMPFGSYHVSDEDAVRNAIRLVKEGGACSVKLEGGGMEADRIAAIAATGIPVMGHIGVMPQTAGLGPGYKKRANRERLLEQAKKVEAAGAYAIVLEVVDSEIAEEITASIAIPTVGIGAGPHCDAQVLVLHDVLGIYSQSPPFAKRFAELGSAATHALAEYAREVREQRFPER